MNAVSGKVALITGGGSGLGLSYARELLRHGLRAVTLADASKDLGNKAVESISKEFGEEKVHFVKTDVTVRGEFEKAFRTTIEKFTNIDILINNAGIMNDSVWERQIGINLVGTVHGCILAVDKYIPKFRTDKEGVVVNISSIAGLERLPALPVYAGTKHAIIGLTRAWGSDIHYDRAKVRFLTLCPGVTDTPLAHGSVERTLGPAYKNVITDHLPNLQAQRPENVAQAMVHIIKHGENGSVWVSEHNKPPYELEIPSRQDIKKKAV